MVNSYTSASHSCSYKIYLPNVIRLIIYRGRYKLFCIIRIIKNMYSYSFIKSFLFVNLNILLI